MHINPCIQNPSMRIVSLAPSNTEILYALGCADMVVACTRYCDFPPEAKSKPKVGGWLDINDQLVEQYKPDVVMTSTFVQDKIVERFKKKGISLFHTDPKTLEQVYGSILSIGKLVEKANKAQNVVDSMKKDFNALKNSITIRQNNTINNKDRPAPHNKTRAYCEEWHKPPTVSGNWVPKIIEIAGGISLCPQGRVSYPVSLEEVSAFDPDCVILSICGMGSKATPDFVSKREGWGNLRAVKENKIFAIDDSLLNRPGPRLVEGARQLAEFFSVKNIQNL